MAYQVLGEGPLDLLVFGPLTSHVELQWNVPDTADTYERLARVCRLIIFDRRGIGASDGVPHGATPTWEDLAEDAGAVLDAVGSKQAGILAISETGPMAILFAATHPDRVSALVLFNTFARYLIADDYTIGVQPDALDTLTEGIRRFWGTRELTCVSIPGAADNEDLLDRVGALFRGSATPRTAAQYDYLLRRLDVRHVLPLIEVPTLVLHAHDNPIVPFEQGRYLAEQIEGATLVELPGADLGLAGPNAYRVMDEITEFLTGERPVAVNRILATALFTDIVGSTDRAASVGDERWRSLLDAHDRIVREQLRRFRGREINTTGDGFLASFDAPTRAIRCAQALLEATNELDLELRIGLHTGECELRGEDLGGLAVHIAARVGALAEPCEVLVTGTVKDLVVGSEIEFIERGEHQLKGVPGTWKLFTVAS